MTKPTQNTDVFSKQQGAALAKAFVASKITMKDHHA